jgi:hypothetical protein
LTPSTILRRCTVLFAGLVVGAGCATRLSTWESDVARAATETPDHFLVQGSAGDEEPPQDGSCRSPLVDPRDRTGLVLVRSAAGRGDYEVPEARYGVGQGELLRVDCASGRALGVVPR